MVTRSLRQRYGAARSSCGERLAVMVAASVAVVIAMMLMYAVVGDNASGDGAAMMALDTKEAVPQTPVRIQPSSTTSKPTDFDNPEEVLSRFIRHNPQVAAAYDPPVGTAYQFPTTSSSTSKGHPPLCGTMLMQALNIAFQSPAFEWVRKEATQETELVVSVELLSNASMYRDMWLVGRAIVGGDVVLGSRGQRDPQQPRVFRLSYGPFPGSIAKGTPVDVDVVLAWVGSFYVGQRWVLPNRNDNPPFLEKKRKCLDLTLVGVCERFGSSLLRTVISVPETTIPSLNSNVLCGAHQVGGHGFWKRLPPGESWETRILDDPVGLNRWNGSVWQWHQTDCRLRLFSKEATAKCFHERSIHRIGLFGDSMIVEFFHQLANLFQAPISQTKSLKMRVMEFQDTQLNIWVRFARSYTTKEGHSVIATPKLIVKQIEAARCDVAVGNFAVLHWQQNMRRADEWSRNVADIHRLLKHTSVVRQGHTNLSARFYYLGPTAIQMGRTQGLQPFRTQDFAQRASVELLVTRNASGPFVFLDPLLLSIARRESAYDGQHWACYHTYGGVSQTILQLWLNKVCH